MKDMCEKRPDFDKIPEICSKIIRRINDEEGIRKIVIETFQSLWFQPVKERDSAALLKKVYIELKSFIIFLTFKGRYYHRCCASVLS